MKFTFIKKVDGEVNIYGGKTAKTGDTVELTGHFEEKAQLNPDYELIKRGPKKNGNEGTNN